MERDPWEGLPRPRLGRRLLIVGSAWLVATGLAVTFTPGIGLGFGVIPLGLAARGVWRARRQKAWQAEAAQLRRKLTTAAVLMAGALIMATLWSFREAVPTWFAAIEIGALLHYWLLGLSDI